MTGQDPIVSATGIEKSFGSLHVLRGLDFHVGSGSVVVLMGPSGSGKTTLIRCLNALEWPDAGVLNVCGYTVDAAGKKPTRTQQRAIRDIRKRASMVFQQFNLFPHMTALENVIEGPMSVHGTPRPEAEELGMSLLRRVGLEDKRDSHPARLSGGQKQRVAIARALAMKPDVILFDEPTSALDPELHLEVLEVIRELAQEGMTMVIVTHEVAFARQVADRIVFMDGGHILEDAPPSEFFSNPEHPRVREFLRLVDHPAGMDELSIEEGQDG